MRGHQEDIERNYGTMATFVSSVAFILASFLLIDVIVVLATGLFGDEVRRAVIRNSHVFWLIPGLTICVLAWILGVRALVPGLFGAVLGYASVLNSRGIWIWPSTFDYYWGDDLRWKWMLMIGLAAGSIAGTALGIWRSIVVSISTEQVKRICRASLWTIALMVTIYIVVEPMSKAESLFPALRAVYVGALAVVLFLASILSSFKLENAHEKGN